MQPAPKATDLVSNASLSGLLTIGVGIGFAYGGITGKSPIQMLHAAVLGQNPKNTPVTQGINYGPLPSTPNMPGSGGSGDAGQQPANAAQAIAKNLMPSYGWNDPADWTALVNLWNMESGWNNLAWNSSSGAFGIAQALGHGVAGQDANVNIPSAGRVVNVNEYPTHAANSGDPTAQIEWGMNYIKQRYGNPQMAWAHEMSNNPHWY